MRVAPYREPSPPERRVDKYLAAWADLHRRRIQMVIAVLLCVPVTGALMFLVVTACGASPRSEVVVVTAFFAPFLATIVLMLRHAAFRCPRCGGLFNVSLGPNAPLTACCLHCRVLVDTPGPPPTTEDHGVAAEDENRSAPV